MVNAFNDACSIIKEDRDTATTLVILLIYRSKRYGRRLSDSNLVYSRELMAYIKKNSSQNKTKTAANHI